MTPPQRAQLDRLSRTTKAPRLRTRAQMILLAAEQGLKVPQMAASVRESEATVLRWLKRSLADDLEGLHDAPRPGRPSEVTEAYRAAWLAAVRRRPRRLGLPFSLWTRQRLVDYLAEHTRVRGSDETVRRALKQAGMALSRPQHKISSPDPDYHVKKKTMEDARDQLTPGAVFYYADEFNISWLPTVRAVWSPRGQHVMSPTPGQPDKRYGLGAVNDHAGATVVLFRRRKRRQEVAELWQALVDKHPTGTIYGAWDHADTPAADEIEAVVRAAAGRLVLRYLPTDSPWLNPIEMLWRHFRREVTHGELFASLDARLKAAHAFFDRYNQYTERVLSIIGAHAA
jgi:transposase